jgi:hypothetical protein
MEPAFLPLAAIMPDHDTGRSHLRIAIATESGAARRFGIVCQHLWPAEIPRERRQDTFLRVRRVSSTRDGGRTRFTDGTDSGNAKDQLSAKPDGGKASQIAKAGEGANRQGRWARDNFRERGNEQPAVDGFVRHSHALVIGVVHLQPSGNLFGRPVQDFTRNDIPQLPVDGEEALLRSQGRVPGMVIRHMGSIGRTATVARISRLTVEAARSRRRTMSRSGQPEAIPREMASRSASVSASLEP